MTGSRLMYLEQAVGSLSQDVLGRVPAAAAPPQYPFYTGLGLLDSTTTPSGSLPQMGGGSTGGRSSPSSGTPTLFGDGHQHPNPSLQCKLKNIIQKSGCPF